MCFAAVAFACVFECLLVVVFVAGICWLVFALCWLDLIESWVGLLFASCVLVMMVACELLFLGVGRF